MDVIRRAFELAETGEFPTIEKLRVKLSREGYLLVDQHLAGRSLRVQLQSRMHLARQDK
jgi:hypothetical protein